MAKDGVDELFEVRNAFYLGNYQLCITEAGKVRGKSPAVVAAKEAFVYRAYIAQHKFSVPLDEIRVASASPGMLMLRCFAQYKASPGKRLELVEELEKKEKGGVDAEDALFFIAGAQIYMAEGNYEAALRLLHTPEDLEVSALRVECLLKLERPELAAKELKRMLEKDEDATLSQLATAWLNMAAGKDKLQDAFYIFQEMMDKYGETGLLEVAQAATCVLQERFEEAEKLLNSALQRDPNSADALANMVTVHQRLGKAPEGSRRYVTQLREAAPQHPFVKDFAALEQHFDRVAASMKA